MTHCWVDVEIEEFQPASLRSGLDDVRESPGVHDPRNDDQENRHEHQKRLKNIRQSKSGNVLNESDLRLEIDCLQNSPHSSNAAVKNDRKSDDHNRQVLINPDYAFKRQGWSIKHDSHVKNHLDGVSERRWKSRSLPKSFLKILKL